MPKHCYTLAQIGFIIANLPGRSHAELTELFNRHFGTDLTVSQITAAAKNRGICNGRDTRIKPGNVPFNKGAKMGPDWGGKDTRFKLGQAPTNYRPVGSERVNVDGYVEIKVADPRTWRSKHVVLWEAANGPIPKGHVLVFGDGNKLNLDLANLVLVSRRELAVMNKLGLIGGSAELTMTGKTIADIKMKIRERGKKKS